MGAFFVSNIESLYPHNKKVFLEAMENLKTHKKLGIVQATGTGKGKLASCFVEHVLKRKPNAKILILAPLHTILDNYRDNFGLTDSEVFFNTYKMLLNFDKTYLHNLGLTYDLIIVDEFHRLGAEKWGPAVKTIFDGVDSPKSNCRVIGFTATPIRYLDNARDMSDELFGGNVIQGLNLEDAICEGILPGFVYNACYFSTEDKLTEVEKKLASNDYKIVDDTIRNDLMVKVKELRMLYHNKLKIENILKETTKDLGSTQKWIIFCRDKDSLDEIREICKTWFVSVPSLYIIHSDKYRSDNRRILKEFRESKSGVNVLLCIDMLNEGVHIKDIDGIIMLRKTDSPIIFLQQLGRALEAGKTTQPLIYDLVGNYKDLKVENGDGLVGHTISIVKGIADKVNKKRSSNCVIVRNFVEDFDNVMGELSQYLPGRPWTEEEFKILYSVYPLEGSEGCIKAGLNRSRASIKTTAIKLGISFIGIPDWTDEEIEIIRKIYPKEGPEGCISAGLNRTKRAIQEKAYQYGILREQNSVVRSKHEDDSNYWSDDELKILKTLYVQLGPQGCINAGIKRKPSSIINKAKKLGLTLKDGWYGYELDILHTVYNISGAVGCISAGLNRSERAIITMANNEGYPYFPNLSQRDLEIIREIYPQKGATACVKAGVSVDRQIVTRVAGELGLNYDRIWSDEELAILYKYYQSGGADACIKAGLNRTKQNIQRKASDMGLSKSASKSWSEWEIEILHKYYHSLGIKGCYNMGLQHRTLGSIKKKALSLGLSKDK